MNNINKTVETKLLELEDYLLDNMGIKPNYSQDAFRAATYVFMSCLMDKIYDLQNQEGLEPEDKLNMVHSAGKDLNKLIKTYTNIDSLEFYK